MALPLLLAIFVPLELKGPSSWCRSMYLDLRSTSGSFSCHLVAKAFYLVYVLCQWVSNEQFRAVCMVFNKSCLSAIDNLL